MTDQHGSSTPQVFIDALDGDSAGNIVVTLCTIWDVKATNARLLNTDFVVSDPTGNVIHCTANATIAYNFHRLEKGGLFAIEDFVVWANKEECRVRKNNTFKLEFDGKTHLRKTSVLYDQYVRYPLVKVHMDNMKPTRNKSLIDVARYVTNIAKMNHKKTGSKNLDFYLTNHRGQAVRVTLWGGLGDLLIDNKMKHVVMCPIVINSTSAYHYYNKLNLSKSPSAMDIDQDIPTFKEFKSSSGGVGQIKAGICIKDCVPKDGTIKTILMLSRNQTNDLPTFHLKATIGNIRTEKGWRFPSCGGKQCQKGTTRMGGDFWCNGCEKQFTYSDMRYRLALDVFDNTDKAVFILFDEPVIQLVKFPASSFKLMDHDPSDERRRILPPPLANLIGTTHVFEIKSHTYYDHEIFESFICCAICPLELSVPTIATPSKSTESKKNKRYVMTDSDQKRKKPHQKQNSERK